MAEVNGSNGEEAGRSIHVAIIPDGNRRFAKRLMLEPWKGHEWGVKKFEDLLDWCKEVGVRKLTFYAFSLKNFKSRPKKEVAYLLNLFRKEFQKLKKDNSKLDKNKIRVNFIGRIEVFPKDIQEIMHSIMERTKKYSDYIINLAMAYDGRAEIIDAIKGIAKKVKDGILKAGDIDEGIVKGHLYLEDDVDLIIRTSGERRTSSFLPWQADYAELAFVDDFWPDFKKEDFVRCVEDFKRRDRRFGK